MNLNSNTLYPDRLSTKTLLCDADRHKVLEQWNQTQVPYPNDVCVHQLFEAQVERTPDAIAVSFEDQVLTYRELNQRANQLAHYLQTLGVAPEVIVGIYLDRSIDMIVGLLGVLKAGGAYVPLDPAHPSDRLSFILADTQVSVVLSQSQWAQPLSTTSATVVCLDQDWHTISQQSIENPVSGAIASSLMYTIYTSGSTGKPKGVLIPHSGICNQLHWRQTTFPLTDADRVLQTISFSFDPSVWQIFWTLCYGAQLVLPRPDGHKDMAYLIQTIAQQQITVIALVPSMLRVLLEEEIDRCTSLKHIFCGGEALPLDLQERFFERFKRDRVLHNVYGPTEASIDATFWTVEWGVTYPIAPIGRPIANAQIYILDADLQPVPIGESGELHIGGAGLARGYLNRPELTQEKFIPHPFAADPNARLYKTGDLARYLPDGNIEFLGRIDHQVKIRGFRIELGEIEAALSHYPEIQQSVVIAREDTPGNQRLVAYLVPAQPQRPTVQDLRQFLQSKLPEYMVPSAFVWLEALPLNPNGKVDRHKLPVPEPERPDLAKPFVAPKDELEADLTQIWESVLKIQPIGVTDNFFEIGGNSLNAARLLNQIEAQFHQKLPISTFLQTPTVAQLAALLRQEHHERPWKSLVAIQPLGSKPPLFCFHARNGNVLGYYRLSKYLGTDQPCYGLELPYLNEERIPPLRIEMLAAAYIREIQMLQPAGPYFLCGYSFGGLLAYEAARQLKQQGHEIALLALLDTYNSPSGWFKPLPRHVRYVRHVHRLSQIGFQEQITDLRHIVARKLRLEVAPVQPLLEECPIRAACNQAASRYLPQVYAGQAVLFRATQQPEHSLLRVKIDRYLGWKPFITEGIEIHDMLCHHFNLLTDPQVRLVAEKMRVCLRKARSEASQPTVDQFWWRGVCSAPA